MKPPKKSSPTTSRKKTSAEILNFRLKDRSVIKMAVVHDIKTEEYSFLINSQNASKADAIFTLQLMLWEILHGEKEKNA